MTNDQIAERILDTLMGQRFTDWYNSRFEHYITGDLPEITKQEILKDIKDQFHLDSSCRS